MELWYCEEVFKFDSISCIWMGNVITTKQRFLTALHGMEQRRSPAPMTVFCDFDGPILDVSERYYQTYQLALADVQAACHAQGITLPISRLQKQQFWHMKQNRVPDLEIAMRSGLPADYFESFLERVTHIVNQPALLHRDRLQPGVRWALSLLRAQGAQLFLVTLRCQNQAEQILQSYGLAELFTDIRGTHDENAAYHNQAEQKTALLSQVMADYGIAPSPTAWMIGDTEADVLAGQSNRIGTIAVTCGIRSQAYLHRFQPSRIHHDLLSAAHYLVYQTEAFPAMVS